MGINTALWFKIVCIYSIDYNYDQIDNILI